MALVEGGKEPAPATNPITWRTFFRIRVAPRVQVIIRIGEPAQVTNMSSPEAVVEQTKTLAQLARLIQRVCRESRT